VFIATLGVRESMLGEIGQIYAVSNYDVGVAFDGAYPDDVLARLALTVPQVVGAESWPVLGAFRVVDRKQTGRRFRLEAPPIDTPLFRPSLLAGRALRRDDENAIVVNTELQQHDP